MQTAVCISARPSAAARASEARSPPRSSLGNRAAQNSPAQLQGRVSWAAGPYQGASIGHGGAKLKFSARTVSRLFSHPMALKGPVGEADRSISLATSSYFGFTPQHMKCFGMKTDIQYSDTIKTSMQTHHHMTNPLKRSGIIILKRFL